LLNKHPDFVAIRDSEDFHEWAKSQQEDIQAWVYNNPHNVGLASRAIDLFKQDMGLIGAGSQSKQTRKKSNKSSNSKAADMVSTKTTTVDTNLGQPKIWTQEEIAALPMDEYDRLESEIDRAVEEGRVRL